MVLTILVMFGDVDCVLDFLLNKMTRHVLIRHFLSLKYHLTEAGNVILILVRRLMGRVTYRTHGNIAWHLFAIPRYI